MGDESPVRPLLITIWILIPFGCVLVRAAIGKGISEGTATVQKTALNAKGDIQNGRITFSYGPGQPWAIGLSLIYRVVESSSFEQTLLPTGKRTEKTTASHEVVFDAQADPSIKWSTTREGGKKKITISGNRIIDRGCLGSGVERIKLVLFEE